MTIRKITGILLAFMVSGCMAWANDVDYGPEMLPVQADGVPAHEDAVVNALQYLTDYYAYTGGSINAEEQKALNAFNEYIEYIKKGAYDEDMLDTSEKELGGSVQQGIKSYLGTTRFVRHFYDNNGNGYTNAPELLARSSSYNNYYQSAINWALKEPIAKDKQVNEYNWFEAQKAFAYPKKDLSVEEARVKSAIGSREFAFICLGHTLHLVADMGVPEHTWGRGHPFSDGLESYIKKNYQSIKYLYYPTSETGTDTILENNTKRSFNLKVTANALPCYPNLRALMDGLSQISRNTTNRDDCLDTAIKDFRTKEGIIFKTHPRNSSYAHAQARFLMPRITMHLAATMDLFWKEANNRNQIPWANKYSWTGYVDDTPSAKARQEGSTTEQDLYINDTVEDELAEMYTDEVEAGASDEIAVESLPASDTEEAGEFTALSVSMSASKSTYALGENLELLVNLEPGVSEGNLMDVYISIYHDETKTLRMIQSPAEIGAVLSSRLGELDESITPLQMNWEAEDLTSEQFVYAEIDSNLPSGHYICTLYLVDSRYKTLEEVTEHVIATAEATWTLE